jgi:hypothetical protein
MSPMAIDKNMTYVIYIFFIETTVMAFENDDGPPSYQRSCSLWKT